MTIGEQQKLAALEETIERGVSAFMEVGRALAAIRDEKLFTDVADTFEEYCTKKWGFTRQRAYQYIEAVTVAESLPVSTSGLLRNERVARELSNIPEKKDQKRVWKKAVETAPKNDEGEPVVTAAHVAAVAEEMEVIPSPEKKPKPAKNGKLRVDNRDFDAMQKAMESIIRGIDKLNDKYPHGNHHRFTLAAAKQVKQSLRDWQGAIR